MFGHVQVNLSNLSDAEQGRCKAACNSLRKLMMKAKPEKMTADDLYNIRNAISRVEASSANACRMAQTATAEDADPEEENTNVGEN